MREYEGHLGLMEGVVLVFTVLSAMLFLQMPQFMVEVGGPAGWQVAVVAMLTAMALMLPVGALAGRFPGRGLAEISVEAVGPFAGPAATLLVTLWLLATTAVALRNFTETFLMSILPDTPPSVLIVVAVCVALFASYKGIEAIGRSAQLLVPLIAGGTVVLLLFSLPRVDISMLFPFWGHGLMNTLGGGIYYGSIAAETIFLLAAGYAFRDGKTLLSSGLWGIFLWGVLAALTIAVLVTVFGSPTASQNPFPLYNLARLVYLGRFLQSTESVLIMFWFFAAAVRLSVCLHATAVSLGGALKLPAYRPLLFPLAVVLVALSMVPEDFIAVLRINRDWLHPLGFGVMALPLLLWLVAAIRGKGGPADAT